MSRSVSNMARDDEPPQPIPPGSVVEYACGRREPTPDVASYCRDCGAPLARILIGAPTAQPCKRANQSGDYPCFPCPD